MRDGDGKRCKLYMGVMILWLERVRTGVRRNMHGMIRLDVLMAIFALRGEVTIFSLRGEVTVGIQG